jgi:1-acyl-sn-glycerol-3-phosphate acyltransferase
VSADTPPGLFSRLAGPPGSPRAWRLFEVGFRPWMKRQLAGIHLAHDEAAPEGHAPELPLLLVANHVSWYDGFLLRELQRRLRPHAPLRTFMLRSELERAPILRWIGGTGFDPARPHTLRGALARVEALREEGVVAAYFPQGRIFPSTRRPLGFAPGVSLLLRRLAPLAVVPVGLHLEMGNRVRPSAWVLSGAPIRIETPGDAPAPDLLEGRVEGLLARVQAHLHAHGEAAAEHWPPAP